MVRLCFKICSLLCLCSPAFAYEDLVIDDWRTTIDNDTCWMTAHPFDQPSSEASRHFNENIRFNILFPYGSPDPQFSIYTNQIEKHNEEVFISLGSETYEFQVITDHAHSKVTSDRDILFQMLKGDTATFVLNVGGGTCRGFCITDQITDQYAPYCSELGYAVLSEYRVLAD